MSDIEYGVPWPVSVLFNRLEDLSATEEEGIFRIPGSVSDTERVLSDFDKGTDPQVARYPTETVASILKKFYRDMTPPLFDEQCQQKLQGFGGLPFEERHKCLMDMLSQFSDARYNTLLRLIGFLREVVANQNVTRMNTRNVSICWATNLFPSSAGYGADSYEILDTIIDDYDILYEPRPVPNNFLELIQRFEPEAGGTIPTAPCEEPPPLLPLHQWFTSNETPQNVPVILEVNQMVSQFYTPDTVLDETGYRAILLYSGVDDDDVPGLTEEMKTTNTFVIPRTTEFVDTEDVSHMFKQFFSRVSEGDPEITISLPVVAPQPRHSVACADKETAACLADSSSQPAAHDDVASSSCAPDLQPFFYNPRTNEPYYMNTETGIPFTIDKDGSHVDVDFATMRKILKALSRRAEEEREQAEQNPSDIEASESSSDVSSPGESQTDDGEADGESLWPGSISALDNSIMRKIQAVDQRDGFAPSPLPAAPIHIRKVHPDKFPGCVGVPIDVAVFSWPSGFENHVYGVPFPVSRIIDCLQGRNVFLENDILCAPGDSSVSAALLADFNRGVEPNMDDASSGDLLLALREWLEKLPVHLMDRLYNEVVALSNNHLGTRGEVEKRISDLLLLMPDPQYYTLHSIISFIRQVYGDGDHSRCDLVEVSRVWGPAFCPTDNAINELTLHQILLYLVSNTSIFRSRRPPPLTIQRQISPIVYTIEADNSSVQELDGNAETLEVSEGTQPQMAWITPLESDESGFNSLSPCLAMFYSPCVLSQSLIRSVMLDSGCTSFSGDPLGDSVCAYNMWVYDVAEEDGKTILGVLSKIGKKR